MTQFLHAREALQVNTFIAFVIPAIKILDCVCGSLQRPMWSCVGQISEKGFIFDPIFLDVFDHLVGIVTCGVPVISDIYQFIIFPIAGMIRSKPAVWAQMRCTIHRNKALFEAALVRAMFNIETEVPFASHIRVVPGICHQLSQTCYAEIQ